MFKKLVSNLPFNPSLITQFGFYAERMRKESSLRRIGFFLMALVMLIQVVAVVSPPEKSLAASSNHIINGIRTKADILAAWDRNGSDIPAIYGKFGVTRADIVALSSNPNATVRSNDGTDWWTIGRNSLWGYANVQQKYKNNQITLQVSGEKTSSTSDDRFVYNRQLRAWDIKNPYNTYSAFKGTISKTKETFWILVDCGNLTKVGPYTPPTPDPIIPRVEVRKTIVNKPTSLKPGDTYSYLLEYQNKVRDSLAKDVFIEDELDIKHFDVISPKDLSITNGFLRHNVGNLSYSPTYKTLTITVKLKDQIPSGTNVCNAARITASNAAAFTSDTVCIGVITPCPFDSTVPDINNPNCSEPKLVCSLVDAAVNLTRREVTFETKVESTNKNNTKILSYTYDFGDDSDTLKHESTAFVDKAIHMYDPGDYTANVVVGYTATGVDGEQKVSCSKTIHFDADKPFGQSKTVRNITQDKDGKFAIESKVNGGDILEYTLTTTNSQGYERTDIDVSDYIGDILDYASLDTDFLKENKGIYDKESEKVIWNNVTIPAEGKVLHSFRVKIKSPIPATNSPSATSTTYDCRISNEYGDEITINVNCPLVKGIETLPNTGPGSSLLIVIGITTIIGYFFARSQLIRKELDIVKTDYATSGGM